MKRIGILIESTHCSKHFFDTVSALAKSKEVELFFLQNSSEETDKSIWGKIKSKIKIKGLFRVVELAFFNLLTVVEYKAFSLSSQTIKNHQKKISIDEFIKNEITYVKPLFSKSGIIIRYSDEDIDKIK